MYKRSKEEIVKQYSEIDKKMREEKKLILDELSNRNELFVNDNIMPESNLCIILSCPGEEELLQNKVCVGDTGENLDKILREVISVIKEIEPKLDDDSDKIRYKYNIINSVETVHFRSYNGAEATVDEINNEDNIQRALKNLKKIKEIKYVIVCGNNADIVLKKIKQTCKQIINNNVKVATVSHLGWVGLRNEYPNNCNEMKEINDQKERDYKRLKLVAETIIKSFSN